VAQHHSTGSEASPSYAPRSSRFGSEPPSVEDDVNVWRYAIVSCMPETTTTTSTGYFDYVVKKSGVDSFLRQRVQSLWLRDVWCLCSGFWAGEESAVWFLLCKQVVTEAQPCAAVKYTGVMDRNNLARYFRVRDLPAIVSIIHCVPENGTRVILNILYSCKSVAMKFSTWYSDGCSY